MNDLATEIKKLLLSKHWSIGVAESLTSGHLQAQITSISGSSEYFVGGLTAYNIDQKVKLLGVDREHAATVNCVSRRVAQEMAVGARRMFGSTIGVATTGYAEPWSEGNVDSPFALFATDIDGQVKSGRIEAAGRNRIGVQRFVAEEVLKRLIEWVGESIG